MFRSMPMQVILFIVKLSIPWSSELRNQIGMSWYLARKEDDFVKSDLHFNIVQYCVYKGVHII